MAGKISAYEYGSTGPSQKRPGIHSKNQSSSNKKSKNYKKLYRGQGR